MSKILIVPADKLSVGPRGNSRRPGWESDAKGLDALAESIRTEGQLAPVIVRWVDKGWEIVAGHRRHAACLRAGLDVEILPVVADDAEAIRLQVRENTSRKDLSPIDLACGMAARKEEGMPQKGIAELYEVAEGYVSQLLKVHRESGPACIEAMHAGKLSVVRALAVLRGTMTEEEALGDAPTPLPAKRRATGEPRQAKPDAPAPVATLQEIEALEKDRADALIIDQRIRGLAKAVGKTDQTLKRLLLSLLSIGTLDADDLIAAYVGGQ